MHITNCVGFLEFYPGSKPYRIAFTITEVGAKALSNEIVRNWLLAAKIVFHSDAVHSTTRRLHSRKRTLHCSHWKLLHILESMYLNVNYLQALCQKGLEG